MKRSIFTFTALGLAGLAMAGCRDESSTNTTSTDGGTVVYDLSTSGTDGGGGGAVDMAKPPVEITINDLYTKGTDKMAVTVKNVVVTGIARYAGKSSKGICQYEAYVQDQGAVAPSGIRLYAKGAPCTMGDGGSCNCPFPPASNTELDKIGNPSNLGDVYAVTGSLSLYTPMSGGKTYPTQHELDVATMTMTGTGGKVNPFVIADGKSFAANADGFVKYENTLVQIKPAAPAAAGTVDMYGDFVWAGAHFGGDYRHYYGKVDGGTFPTAGQTFSAITGIATLPYGGGVAPRISDDFAP